jgi:hypothetical protein
MMNVSSVATVQIPAVEVELPDPCSCVDPTSANPSGVGLQDQFSLEYKNVMALSTTIL